MSRLVSNNGVLYRETTDSKIVANNGVIYRNTVQAAGWTGKAIGVTSPGKVNGVDNANIAAVNGVT